MADVWAEMKAEVLALPLAELTVAHSVFDSVGQLVPWMAGERAVLSALYSVDK